MNRRGRPNAHPAHLIKKQGKKSYECNHPRWTKTRKGQRSRPERKKMAIKHHPQQGNQRHLDKRESLISFLVRSKRIRVCSLTTSSPEHAKTRSDRTRTENFCCSRLSFRWLSRETSRLPEATATLGLLGLADVDDVDLEVVELSHTKTLVSLTTLPCPQMGVLTPMLFNMSLVSASTSS